MGGGYLPVKSLLRAAPTVRRIHPTAQSLYKEDTMTRLNQLIAAATAGVALMIAPLPASAATGQLRLVDLGTLGGQSSRAHAINDRGEIVGIADTAGAAHAFLWRSGRMIDLGTLGGGFSEAFDINSWGHVVGYSTTASGEAHAFLWRNGRMSDLGTLAGPGHTSIARSISDWGDVVGDDFGPAGGQAFLWRGGQMSALAMPPGGEASSANAVNNRGDVVGSSFGAGVNSSVRWHDGHPILLAGHEAVTAINDRGVMTCGPFNSLDSAWLRDGTAIIPIGRPAGSTVIQAAGLNSRGTVVGFTDLGAFVWQGGRMSILPSLAGERTSAADVNEIGQIAGTRSVTPEGAITHAVLWTRD